jgi:hypothetical protein
MAKEVDFTLTEARDAFEAFRLSISEKCHCSVSLRPNGTLLHALVCPDGITQKAQFWAYADTFRELLSNCEAKWAEHSDLHAKNLIRRMALKIIEITADIGECSDAALRAEFSRADVERYGDRACEHATEIASNGPFSIVRTSGANAEAA